MGKLGHALEVNEAGTFAGLWIRHQPEYRIVVAFPRNGEEAIRPYLEGGSLVEIVEIRNAVATLQYFQGSQMEASKIVAELGFQPASGINVFENRVELYPSERERLIAALKD